MNTIVLSPRSYPMAFRVTAAALVAVLILLFVGVSIYGITQGDQVSELLIGRSGVSDSNLVISRSGTNGALDVGLAPVISNAWSSNVTANTATLNGTLSSLNGMPTAEAWFVWGYDGVAFPNETAHATVAAPGSFSAAINFNMDATVYFRAATAADATTYSSTVSFTPDSASGFQILSTGLPLMLAATILITVILMGLGASMLIATIIGLIGFSLILAIIDII